MTKRISLLIALVLVVAMFAFSVNARVMPTDPRLERINTLKATFGQAMKTPIADDGSTSSNSAPVARQARLGSALAGPNSRGALVANTWRDWGSNASTNRTVAVTTPGNTYGTGVQFTFMWKTSSLSSDRTKWGWNGYDATAGAFVTTGGKAIVQSTAPAAVEAGSYPKIMIYPKNGKGIAGSYDFPDQQNNATSMEMHLSFESPTAFSGNFGNISGGSVMADSLNKRGNVALATYNTIWPAVGMTATATDTVLYLFGFEATSGEPFGALKVFRHATTARSNPDNLWQLVMIDTTFFPTQDFAASRTSGRVAAIWVNYTPAGRPTEQGGNCDIYYADSPTGLANTWTKHNVTNYTGATYRAWLECAGLFDSADKLHIIWNASPTDGTVFLADRSCRLFHWSEYNAPGVFNTVYSAPFSAYDLPCIGGSNVMNVGKFNIGQCGNKLYTIFSDWNDPQLETLGDSDCAKTSDWLYGGNGELYVTVSKDTTGQSWDKPRNLSHSYAKNCDTLANCADDKWASISTTGIDNNVQPGTWPASALYDPSGSYTGSNFTQVWYVTDRYPGGVVLSPPQGIWSLNDMRWIRMACVDPVVQAILATTPGKIDFPAYTKPGVEKDTNVILENVGNTNLAFSSILTPEDSCKGPGCLSGWLGYTGVTGASVIPEAGTVTMSLQLNKAGVISNATAPHRLWGRVLFTYGPPTRTDTMKISMTIADSVANVKFDTLTTVTSIKLVVGSNGNMGNNYTGKVNMGFQLIPAGAECDTGSNSRGNALIYLGDASPVIVRKVGVNAARASWSIFSQGYVNPNGFKPLPPGSGPLHGTSPKDSTYKRWQQYFSGTFATVDSLLKVEKTWYAPIHAVDVDTTIKIVSPTKSDTTITTLPTAEFIIQKMQVWPSNPGTQVTNLAIGEAYDWDIPADSGSYNYGGTDATRKLVWQRGYNSPNDTIIPAHGDTAAVLDCYNNGLRYGGSALIAITNEKFIDSCQYTSDSLYGGYTARNDSFVYKASGFVPEQLWSNMQTTGYFNQDGTNTYTDLHTVLTFRNVKSSSNGGWTIPAQARDTLTVYSIMAVSRPSGSPSVANALLSLDTTIDKGKKWANFFVRGCKSCCVGKRGNVNMAGVIDLSDLSSLVSFLTGGSFVPPCMDAANVNGAGVVDLSDLSSLVSFLTGGSFALVNCP